MEALDKIENLEKELAQRHADQEDSEKLAIESRD
jgi:hypothetical protein